MFYFEKALAGFEVPPDDQILWRFMSFASFVSYLERNCLVFRRAIDQDDKWEGAFSLATLERRRAQDEAQKTDLDSAMLCASRSVGKDYIWQRIHVNCWYADSEESFAMWKLYGSAEKGQTIAIKTTWADLKSSIAPNAWVGGALVQYIDYTNKLIRDFDPDDTDSQFPLEAFFYKRLGFQHEKELRLFSINHHDRPIEAMKHDEIKRLKGAWLEIQVSTSQLANEIVLDPEAEDWFKDLVEAVCKKYGLNSPIRPSSLAAKPITWDQEYSN